MSVVAVPTQHPDQLRHLVGRLATAEGFDDVVTSLQAGHGATLDGVRGSSCALVAATLQPLCDGTLIVVCAHQNDVDEFADDLTLFSQVAVERFPAWDSIPEELLVHDEVFGDRLRVLKLLRSTAPPRLIITSIQGLLQSVPEPARLALCTKRVAVGDRLDPEELSRWLVEQGFDHTSAVELPGEFSLRGGIIDVFAPDWFEPVRIEFFGDTVESIRRFEVASQRSLETRDAIEVTVMRAATGDRDHLASYLPPRSWFVLVEPGELEEEGRHYLNRLERPESFHTVSDALRRVYEFPSVTAASLSITSLETTCHLRIDSVERFSGDIAKVRQELDAAGEGNDVYLVCQNEAETQRLNEIFGDTRLANDGKLHYVIGRLRSGFRLISERTVVISGGELFHRTDMARPTRRRLGRVIDSFLELREGDYVVHISHGIGRYRGLKLLEKGAQTEEHLEIEFADEVKIFVPAAKIELVQKYVGGAKARPQLAKIGGKSWVKQKAAAESAVVDLASDMLELQAARAARPGIAFRPDSDWQREFDAAFPYRETNDQLSAIAAIKQDMLAARPMDRLLCGDVGFGKTEVAMRAVFKAVDAGYQVAVLVPTTILAAQHGRTFRARMSEYPFRIEVLSRFCTPKEERRTIAGLTDGSVDIVIGTHRLAQTDIQFHNLGLVIIDEEQRFGVAVKERLKVYRHIVDVLTMTATPIPRTLHLSLLGVRDISSLETAPADRQPVETRVIRSDNTVIRHAVMRELNRDGQVFFVHNRVHDIKKVAWELQQIVPEASIGIAHGQMPEHELEEVMVDFIERKYDILLATTIVESGLDIPNANTIFIDQADQYGLADLHQLRGRVGRYKHRAYCYLLLDPNKPLVSNAAKRLAAIEEFSNMGAGFAIAMRDLEIRGAGNILGTEQSGHISAVGYELYCELLEKTVRKLKDLPPKVVIDTNIDLPGEAFIPRRYVSDMRVKIDLYRRLARVSQQSELVDLRAELADRFGPLPAEVERLLARVELSVLAHRWDVVDVHLEDRYVVLAYRTRPKIEELARRHKGQLRVVDGCSAYCTLRGEVSDPDMIYGVVKSLLQPR